MRLSAERNTGGGGREWEVERVGCEYRMIMSRYDVCGLAASHGTTLHPRLPSSSFLSTRNVYPAILLPQRASKSDLDSSQVIIWLALLARILTRSISRSCVLRRRDERGENLRLQI